MGSYANGSTSPKLVKVFVGTIIHSASLTDLRILNPGIIGVTEAGSIAFCEDITDNDVSKKVQSPNGEYDPVMTLSDETVSKLLLPFRSRFQFEDDIIVRLSETQIIIPGFVDTHIHAPQYVFTGTGLDLPLMDWLNNYTFPRESNFSDESYARDAYTRAVQRSLRCGTTTASYFATIHLSACKILTDIIEEVGQRAYIGKVNMDRFSPDTLRETSEESYSDTLAFVDYVQSRGSDLMTPVLTPRFAISCTNDLLTKLGQLAKDRNLPIQSHLSENDKEIAFVRELFPDAASYTDVYHRHGLLTDRSIMAHCIHLTDDERELMLKSGAGVSHCPCSNFSLESGVCNVRRLLNEGVKVGLGTDVAGGYSPSILDSIRQAITASKVTAFHAKQTASADAEAKPTPSWSSLSHGEAFYLATVGGAQVMGLEDKIGNFIEGKDFDALLIDLADSRVPREGYMAQQKGGSERGVIDLFPHDTVMSLFEKFIFLGDDRCISQVWVRGRPCLKPKEIPQWVVDEFNAANKEIDFLNRENFRHQTARGDWFIFLGASWCPHCMVLTPKWRNIQKSRKDELIGKNMRMAKVECMENGDFCEKDENVLGFPAVRIYRNGLFMEEYDSEDYSEEALNKYLDSSMEKLRNGTFDAESERDGNGPLLETELSRASAIAASHVKPKPNTNTKGEVIYLTDATYSTLTNNSDWFIMFHAPWCGHCKNLAPTWAELAAAMKNEVNIGKVDCTTETKLTKRFNIRGFPTLKFIQEPFNVAEFKGRRTLEELEKFARSFFRPPFKAIKAHQISDAIKSSEASLYYFYDPKTIGANYLENFANVAASVQNEIPVFVSPDVTSFKRFFLDPSDSPAVLLVKDGGTERLSFKASLELDTDSSKLNLKDWILQNKEPLVAELDAHSSEKILRPDRLAVIAIVDPKAEKTSEIIALLRMTAKEWAHKHEAEGKKNNVVFSWLDGVDKVEYTSRVYGIKAADFPRIVVADPKDDRYYDVDHHGKFFEFEKEKLLHNLQTIKSGKLKSKSTHGMIEGFIRSIAKAIRPFAEFFSEHPLLVTAVLISLMGGLFYWLLKDPQPAGGNYGEVPNDPKAE
ncbi:hypothetical protein HDU76_011065 [Blyttiomyces sp. JEL0837]|nr:hypothetical protein HDU76_011065 [Blyttiomyces sp. JEL0837]